jgi:hypothetical protein
MFAELNFTSLSLFAKELHIDDHTSTQNAPITTYLPGTTVKYGFSGQRSGSTQPTYSLPYSNMGISVGANFDLK